MEVAWANERNLMWWRSPGLQGGTLHSQPSSAPNVVQIWLIAVPLWASVSPLPWATSEFFHLQLWN